MPEFFWLIVEPDEAGRTRRCYEALIPLSFPRFRKPPDPCALKKSIASYGFVVTRQATR